MLPGSPCAAADVLSASVSQVWWMWCEMLRYHSLTEIFLPFFFFSIIPTAVSVLHMGPVLKCSEQGHEACKDISIMLLLWDTAFLGKQEMFGRNPSNSRDYLVFQLRWLCECQVGTTHTKFLVDILLTMRFVANRSCRVDQDNSDVSFHFSAMHFPGASRGFCFAQQSTNSFGT